MSIKQALISVSDKTGILDFAQKLTQRGIVILSTGGTAKLLRDAGIAVIEVGDYTGFPEMLDGRVKTLHPKIHAGILARDDLTEHQQALEQSAIPNIELVIVNLYPFKQAIANPDCSLDDAIENIDIGGPTMVRAAAKNHRKVTIVTDPADYGSIIAELDGNNGSTRPDTRFALAKKSVYTHGILRQRHQQLFDRAGSKQPPPRFSRCAQFEFQHRATLALWREPAPKRGVLSG